MRVVVLGPDMENRPLPQWAFRPVEERSLTALEILVQRIGREIYRKDEVKIVGLPWVNPRGSGRAFASLSDYLQDPVSLLRALRVAFIGSPAQPCVDRALIVCESNMQEQKSLAQAWLSPPRLTSENVSQIAWLSLPSAFEALLASGGEDIVIGTDIESQRRAAKSLALSGSEALRIFCKELRSLFQ